jgi:hypothetical protein
MQSEAMPATLTARARIRRALPEARDEALFIWSKICLVRHQFILSNFCSKYQGRELMTLPAETCLPSTQLIGF